MEMAGLSERGCVQFRAIGTNRSFGKYTGALYMKSTRHGELP